MIDGPKGIPTPSPLWSLEPLIFFHFIFGYCFLINHTTSDTERFTSRATSIVLSYHHPLLFFLFSKNYLNPQENEAKLLCFKCHFVNYLQLTPVLIPSI